MMTLPKSAGWLWGELLPCGTAGGGLTLTPNISIFIPCSLCPPSVLIS